MGSKFDVVEGGPKTIPLVFEINNHIILISPVEQLVKEGLRVCAGPVTQTNYDIKCFINL